MLKFQVLIEKKFICFCFVSCHTNNNTKRQNEIINK